MSKIQELKIRFQVWWENASGGTRALGTGFFVVLVLAIFGGGFYAASPYFLVDSDKLTSPLASKNDGKDLEDVVRPRGEGENTVPSPINGVFYTEEEAELFMNRRPLAIMINNHTEARPQFGLSKADLVYEAVAEGGITRMLAFFHAWDMNKVGPVLPNHIWSKDGK